MTSYVGYEQAGDGSAGLQLAAADAAGQVEQPGRRHRRSALSPVCDGLAAVAWWQGVYRIAAHPDRELGQD